MVCFHINFVCVQTGIEIEKEYYFNVAVVVPLREHLNAGIQSW